MMDVAGTRYLVRACIGGSVAVSVVSLGIGEPRTSLDEIRELVGAIARSLGVRIAGRELHFDVYGGLNVPFYVGPDGARAGLAVRGAFSVMWGRPIGALLLFDVALGVASSNYDPKPSSDPDADPDSVDLVAGLSFGGGVALTRGPVTAGLAVTLNLDGYFPGTRDWLRGVGLLALQLGETSRVEVQTGVGVLHQTITPELRLRIGPFVSMLRTTNLVDTEGSRGWDITAGVGSDLD